jgi:hypothetical protein
VVLGVSELLDRAAEQADLHAELHQQGQVVERDALEQGDVAGGVGPAADLGGVGGQARPVLEELPQPPRDQPAVGVGVQAVPVREPRLRQGRAAALAELRMVAVQNGRQGGDVE